MRKKPKFQKRKQYVPALSLEQTWQSLEADTPEVQEVRAFPNKTLSQRGDFRLGRAGVRTKSEKHSSGSPCTCRRRPGKGLGAAHSFPDGSGELGRYSRWDPARHLGPLVMMTGASGPRALVFTKWYCRCWAFRDKHRVCDSKELRAVQKQSCYDRAKGEKQ